MVNQLIRTLGFTLIQCLLAGLLLLVIAPYVMTHQSLTLTTQLFFQTHHTLVLMLHGIFYLAMIWFWPLIIKFLCPSHPCQPSQYQHALSARWYLVITLALVDILAGWQQP